MTTHLRYAIGAATGSLICLAFATALVLDGLPWISLTVLGTAALLAWDTRRETRLHRRRLAEHDLARRRALGETVPALTPCCLLNPRSKGHAHDHRCTLPGPATRVLPADDTTAGWTAYQRLAAQLTGGNVRTECPCGCGRPWSVGGRS
ncbi:hypothetical protein [Streptomyces graminilatus]|uniref:hypothetical protein n=1 Tax=Streptomyces graminilatus TaxID=1464070 RepID=UPI0006E1C0DC|nr:hypothetical protein [Streptomyces graminilatus]